MSSTFFRYLRALFFLLPVFVVNPVFADRHDGVGHHPGAQQRHYDRRGGRHGDDGRRYRDWDRGGYKDHGRVYGAPAPYRGGPYFVPRQRTIVHNYFYDNYRGAQCPPGLAKKHNGCMPPGLARPWVVGRPLPRNVVYYDIPQPVVLGLGYPPPGYRFVRVAADILLIAVGTGMVMDAIYDLGGGW